MRDVSLGLQTPQPANPEPAYPHCLPQPVPLCCCSIPRQRHRRATHAETRWALTFEEESLSPDLGHRVEVSVASVGHVPPEPAERCPGEHSPGGQRGATSSLVSSIPQTTSPLPPEPPAEDHRLRPSVVPHAQTQPSARGFPRRDWETLSLKTALWQTRSLGRWRPSLGVKRGHALHLPASITGEGRAGSPLPGGTAWLSRLPPGSRTRGGREPSSILLRQLGTLLL